MLKNVFRFLLKVSAAFLLLSVLSVTAFRFIPVPFTPLMLLRCVQQAGSHKPLQMRKEWKPLSKISPHLQIAVVASEDQKFLSHMGFDFKAIQEDIAYNKTHKIKRGASTISQQTAKNLFLWPSRSLIRKGFEAYFTFLIELFWPKERIMEVYLNIIEMGDGIYGAEAAAQAYFRRHAADLSSSQAAAIAAIIPDPLKWKISPPSAIVTERQEWILLQMDHLGGKLDYGQKKEELTAPKRK